ncbi:MAG: thiamine pyrophosphate-dependent enzyme, partial [Planctomycetota bacterium]
FNEVIEGEGSFGIVTSGISGAHVREALNLMDLRVPVLKLGTTHPLPAKKISSFLAGMEKVLVVEELMPYLELRVAAMAKEANPSVEILGKGSGHFPTVGEYNVMIVTKALEELTGAASPVDFDRIENRAREWKQDLPARPPTFCPGCPHRGTFWALNRALRGRDVVFNNDIGCYSMMILPPYERTDSLLSMGASFGVDAGMQHVLKDKVVSACGDSTFFHAALPGLVNAVRHDHDMTVIIVQNDVTAMTGQQASPASDFGPRMAKAVDIEEVVRAVGVEHVGIMNAFDPKAGVDILKKALDHGGVSVVISRGPCALYGDRKKRKGGDAIIPRMVRPDLCRSIHACIRDFHCPAIEVDPDSGRARIVENLCNGCGNCARLCPASAIEAKGGE